MTTEPIPEETVRRVERLTRLARRAVDDAEAAAYREERAALLDDHGYECRVREEGTEAVLVCYPGAWLDEDGTVDFAAVEDTDDATEVRLSGTGDPDEWEAVAEHNEELAAAVRETHGDVHGDNAAAFAAFMSNHYAKRAERATPAELREFASEYFPRNAWPSDAQRASLDASLDYVFEAADREPPTRR